MSTELQEVCGNFPENYTPLDIASDPSFIFENDPAYTAVQLWDKEGNTIFCKFFLQNVIIILMVVGHLILL